MITTENFVGKSYQTTTAIKSKHFIIRFGQLVFLVSIFVFLTGHEASNPKIGKSIVDFYLDDITTHIHTQSTVLLLSFESDTTGEFENYINFLTADFYQKRSFHPLWTYNFITTAVFDTLISFIDSLDYLGIPSEILNSSSLIILQKKLKKYNDDESLNNRIALEIHATRAFFKSLVLTHRGIFTNDTTTQFNNYIRQLPEAAIAAIKKQGLKKLFNDNQPQIIPYTKLVNALPPFIDNRRIIHTIQIDSLLTNENFLATTFYNVGFIKSADFDSVNNLEYTVKQFQKARGIKPTGILDSITFDKLISSIDNRYYQICLNLDRLRKVEQQDSDYLFINIPSYKLWVIKDFKAINSFKVVVGKKQSPTPVLSSKINKVVANPFWTVPRSIIRNEMLHKIREDSSFLERNGYMIINNREEVINETEIDWSSDNPLSNQYWIRQKYGRRNALGLVKFLFPNNYRIYLHDTPSKKLFKKEYRAYSHGCIRLENPEALAQHIFDNYLHPTGDSLNIHSLIKSRDRNIVTLPVEIPIHIQYLTCLGGDNGEILFFSDIYNRDNEKLKELFIRKSQI